MMPPKTVTFQSGGTQHLAKRVGPNGLTTFCGRSARIPVPDRPRRYGMTYYVDRITNGPQSEVLPYCQKCLDCFTIHEKWLTTCKQRDADLAAATITYPVQISDDE